MFPGFPQISWSSDLPPECWTMVTSSWDRRDPLTFRGERSGSVLGWTDPIRGPLSLNVTSSGADGNSWSLPLTPAESHPGTIVSLNECSSLCLWVSRGVFTSARSYRFLVFVYPHNLSPYLPERSSHNHLPLCVCCVRVGMNYACAKYSALVSFF